MYRLNQMGADPMAPSPVPGSSGVSSADARNTAIDALRYVVAPSKMENKILCGGEEGCKASHIERAVLVGGLLGLGTYVISKSKIASGAAAVLTGTVVFFLGSLFVNRQY
jgi:hypothetical protein